MLDVKEISRGEMAALLLRGTFGHLGCSRDGHPYVVPMNYAYDSESLYFFTTEGTKTEYISANHEVCFQVEEITDPSPWQSVIVFGRAERVTRPDDMERAIRLIAERNPTLTPALNRTTISAWTRLNNIVIYCVRPHSIHGRKTA